MEANSAYLTQQITMSTKLPSMLKSKKPSKIYFFYYLHCMLNVITLIIIIPIINIKVLQFYTLQSFQHILQSLWINLFFFFLVGFFQLSKLYPNNPIHNDICHHKKDSSDDC